MEGIFHNNPEAKRDVVINIPPDSFHFDNPEHKAEVIGFIRKEIELGAEQIGLTGSRVKGTHQPNASDTDMIAVNQDRGRKNILPDQRVGHVNYSGKQPGQPSIHITRIPREKLGKRNRNETDAALSSALKSTVWVWKKPTPPPVKSKFIIKW